MRAGELTESNDKHRKKKRYEHRQSPLARRLGRGFAVTIRLWLPLGALDKLPSKSSTEEDVMQDDDDDIPMDEEDESAAVEVADLIIKYVHQHAPELSCHIHEMWFPCEVC